MSFKLEWLSGAEVSRKPTPGSFAIEEYKQVRPKGPGKLLQVTAATKSDHWPW